MWGVTVCCLHCRRCSCVIYLGLLVIVGFEASNEERMADGQSLHEGVQRLTELTAQCRHLFVFVYRALNG